MIAKVKSILVAIMLFCALIVVADKWILPWYIHRGDEVVVPNLMRLDITMGKEILSKLELNFEIKKRYDKNVKPGTIIFQSPEANAEVKTGRVIRISVADDGQTVAIPDLRLSTYRDAIYNLQTLGLVVGKLDSLSSNEFPKGIILKQTPPASEQVNTGSAVDMTVSLGNDLTDAKVPFLIQKSLNDAKSMIVDAGLRLGKIDRKVDASLLPNTVLSQSLDSSTIVTPLTAIDLVVSAEE